jgi:hypothetical protein
MLQKRKKEINGGRNVKRRKGGRNKGRQGRKKTRKTARKNREEFDIYTQIVNRRK